MYNIKAYLPVVESFGFTSVLRAATSGQAFPQCVFDHWEVMTQDPLQAGTQANQLILDIRKRKGIKPEPSPLNEYEDKVGHQGTSSWPICCALRCAHRSMCVHTPSSCPSWCITCHCSQLGSCRCCSACGFSW